MARLETFLGAEDLDDLLRARQAISFLSTEESKRVESVLREWVDQQAIANLLFHPDLIPSPLRFEALDRGLQSTDVRYFALAATVGFQGIALKDVPDHNRDACIRALLGLVRSTSEVFAGRASVTLFGWATSAEPCDILPEWLSLYPVPDEGACRNMVAAVLARSAEMSAQEFDRQLTHWCVSIKTRAALEKARQDYEGLKSRDEFRARLMMHPALCYIPNLVDVS